MSHKKLLSTTQQSRDIRFLFTQLFVKEVLPGSAYIGYLTEMPVTKETPYTPSGRDLGKQLTTVGYVPTAYGQTDGTKSIVMGAKGSNFILTSKYTPPAPSRGDLLRASCGKGTPKAPQHSRLGLERVQKYEERYTHPEVGTGYGVGTLGLETSAAEFERLYTTYTQTYPEMIAQHPEEHTDLAELGASTKQIKGTHRSFSVYFYPDIPEGETRPETLKPDRGVEIMFVHRTGSMKDILLPSLKPTGLQPEVEAYSDHWVSNTTTANYKAVHEIMTAIGFETPVDFATGVVAAGDAAIESIVFGMLNEARQSHEEVFRDLSNLFFPVNRKETDSGHVASSLRQRGSSVQHLAQRVEDLVDFITKANAAREKLGEGFTFLNIPRAYYGTTNSASLQACLNIPADQATVLLTALTEEGVLNKYGELSLNYVELLGQSETFKGKLSPELVGHFFEENDSLKENALTGLGKTIYFNLYRVLKDTISHEKYLGVVENKILLDIQGDDVLFQIFTSEILKEDPGQQCSFLEFIQRVCDPKQTTVKGGCGGFGIRNFITLFLSIEISKAMKASQVRLSEAQEAATPEEANKLYLRYLTEEAKIEIYTQQMHLAQPLLSEITDHLLAMAELDIVEESAKYKSREEAILAIKEQLKALNESARNAMTSVRLGDIIHAQERVATQLVIESTDPAFKDLHAIQGVIKTRFADQVSLATSLDLRTPGKKDPIQFADTYYATLLTGVSSITEQLIQDGERLRVELEALPTERKPEQFSILRGLSLVN